MTIILIVIFGLIGLTIGSFLNVCIDRLPAEKSLAYPPSHCDACGRPLKVRDLIPVLSYIWIRGKCRYCSAPIPLRVPLVELCTGILFAFLFWQYGLTYQFALFAVYAAVLLTISVIDLQHKLILNVIVYPMAVIVCIIDIFLPGIGWWQGLAGGAIGFAILLIPALFSRSGMGWGDVKLAGLIGLMTGFRDVFVAILGGVILGGIVAVILVALKKKSRKDTIAFGPFLALGAFIALLWGEQIIDWYLRLFGI
jgi:leader peptidase (prepilin peptidase) / N-methyltransferase